MLHAGGQGLLAGAAAVPCDARRHRPQPGRGDRIPGPRQSTAAACGWWSPRCRTTSTPAGWSRRSGPPQAGTASRRSPCFAPSPSTASTRSSAEPRRDEEKARAKERVFSFRDEFGQWDPKNQRPELWNLYNGRSPQGRAHPGVPTVQLDRARHLAVHPRGADRAARLCTTPTTARSSSATGCFSAVSPFVDRAPGEEVFEMTVRFRTDRRRHLHRLRRVGGVHRRAGRRRGGRFPAHRAGRHPGRRPHLRGRHGRQEEGGLLLSVGAAPAGHGGQRGRRQVHPHRPAALRLQVDLLRPARGRRAHQPGPWRRVHQSRAAHRRSAGRSGSRGSPSTSRTAISRRPSANSSSPTPPAMPSTPATW